MTIKHLVIGGVAGAALATFATLHFSGAAAAPPAGAEGAPATAAIALQPASVPAAQASGAASAPLATASLPTANLACPPVQAAPAAQKPAAPAAPAASPPDVPAIALSAEHASMLVNADRVPTLQEKHAIFAGEPPDRDWSRPMEAQLRQALQEAGVQNGFELLAVECRRTMCELRLFGNVPDAAQRWNGIVSQVAQHGWWSQQVQGWTVTTMGPNDRLVIAAILDRKR